MNITIKPWVLIVVVFVAAFAGAVMSKSLVSPAQAQKAPRWEYSCFSASNPEQAEAKAKNAGSYGWELVGGAGGSQGITWCAKRLLP